MTPPFSTGKDRAFVTPGAAGTVLTSNGPTVNPSYQANSGGATPGASGTVLTSNGPSVAPSYQANAAAAGANLFITSVAVTSAQLKALPGTKPPIVAAPGAGKVIIPVKLYLQYKFLTTAYTIGNADNKFALLAHIGGEQISGSILATGLVDQTSNHVSINETGAPPVLAPQTDIANSGLDLTLLGTTPALTLGDGTLEVSLLYAVLTLA
jgi:hypothetical protein